MGGLQVNNENYFCEKKKTTNFDQESSPPPPSSFGRIFQPLRCILYQSSSRLEVFFQIAKKYLNTLLGPFFFFFFPPKKVGGSFVIQRGGYYCIKFNGRTATSCVPCQVEPIVMPPPEGTDLTVPGANKYLGKLRSCNKIKIKYFSATCACTKEIAYYIEPQLTFARACVRFAAHVACAYRVPAEEAYPFERMVGRFFFVFFGGGGFRVCNLTLMI